MFSLIYTWTSGWANNGDASALRRHRANYDVTVIQSKQPSPQSVSAYNSPVHARQARFVCMDKISVKRPLFLSNIYIYVCICPMTHNLNTSLQFQTIPWTIDGQSMIGILGWVDTFNHNTLCFKSLHRVTFALKLMRIKILKPARRSASTQDIWSMVQ